MSDFKKVFSEQHTTLDFSPFTEKRIYGYTCQIFDDEELINTIHYKIEVSCLYSHVPHTFNFQINRKLVHVDNQKADKKFEEIADNCSKAIYPVTLKVSDENQILEILNHSEIKKRWQKTKQILFPLYKGEWTPAILNQTEKVLNNKTLLLESLYQTWFFDLYFRPLYTTYTKNDTLDYVWKSPVFGHKLIKYGVEQSLEEYYSKTNKITIHIAGNAVDKRSIKEIVSNNEYSKNAIKGIENTPVDSQMDIQYKLYGEDHSIYSITATYKTILENKKQRTTNIEIYHLPENPTFRPDKIIKAKPVSEPILTPNDEDYIFDPTTIAVPPKKQKSDQMILGPPREIVQLYIPGPYEPIIKKTLWKRLLSIFKKKKKIIPNRPKTWKKTTT